MIEKVGDAVISSLERVVCDSPCQAACVVQLLGLKLLLLVLTYTKHPLNQQPVLPPVVDAVIVIFIRQFFPLMSQTGLQDLNCRF